MTAAKHNQRMEEVQRWEDVPVFATEDEERAYWDTHTLSEAILAEMDEGPGDPQLPVPRGHGRTQAISVRLDAELLQRVKAIARQRNVRYQPLLKQWIADRLMLEEAAGSSTPPTPAAQGSFGFFTAEMGRIPFNSIDIDTDALARSVAEALTRGLVAAPHLRDQAIFAAISRAQQSLNELAGLAINTSTEARSKSVAD